VTVVEPGSFRTDFPDSRSLAVSPARITDYDATAGVSRDYAGRRNHAQPGDPVRLAQGILRLADAAEPPLRMPFGSDTLARIEAKNASVAAELAAWQSLSASTDYPAQHGGHP
jgi:hypothetical protein